MNKEYESKSSSALSTLKFQQRKDKVAMATLFSKAIPMAIDEVTDEIEVSEDDRHRLN